MPEGTYRWRVTLSRDTWKRPRWPWARTLTRFHGEALEGEQIPTHHKGPCYGTSGGEEVSSVEEAIGAIVGRLLDDRAQRGYCPEDGKYYRAQEEAAE